MWYKDWTLENIWCSLLKIGSVRSIYHSCQCTSERYSLSTQYLASLFWFLYFALTVLRLIRDCLGKECLDFFDSMTSLALQDMNLHCYQSMSSLHTLDQVRVKQGRVKVLLCSMTYHSDGNNRLASLVYTVFAACDVFFYLWCSQILEMKLFDE